ncbi:MAG: hypothetical protein IJZ02_02855 [Clostridia bacterium]|nr:hypothetical protein [Clostridia bacterium]
MMQQNVSGRTHRPTAQQMSNLPIEDQLRVRFANRGLGAVGVNSSRPQQNVVRPQPSYARPKQPRPNVETVRKTAIQQSESRPSAAQVPLYAVKKTAAAPLYAAKVKGTPLPVAMLICLLVCTMTVLSVVWGSAMVGGAADEVHSLESQVAELAESRRELSQALDRKNDLREIERIAVEELGMIGTDLITKKYISVSGIDMIEAFDTEDKESVGLSTLLSAIGISVN